MTEQVDTIFIFPIDFIKQTFTRINLLSCSCNTKDFLLFLSQQIVQRLLTQKCNDIAAFQATFKTCDSLNEITKELEEKGYLTRDVNGHFLFIQGSEA